MYCNARKVLRKHFGPVPRPGNYRRWSACRDFIRQFCGDDALCCAMQSTINSRWAEASVHWMKASWIRPSLLAHWIRRGLRDLVGRALRRAW